MEHIGYYGRRKRNFDFSRFKESSPSTSIKWDDEPELEEGYEYEDEGVEEEEQRVEEYNKNDNFSNEQQLFLDGKPFVLKQKPKKESFAETHIRVTTYLEKNVNQIIRMLQKQGQIESITHFINESIKFYLMEQYSAQNNK